MLWSERASDSAPAQTEIGPLQAFFEEIDIAAWNSPT